MDYYYDGLLFGNKSSVEEYVKNASLEKCKHSSLRDAIENSKSDVPMGERVWLYISRYGYYKYIFRADGFFSDFGLDIFPVAMEDSTLVDIYWGSLISEGTNITLARKTIDYTLKKLFKNDYNRIKKNNEVPDNVFKFLNYATEMQIRSIRDRDHDKEGIFLNFDCMYYVGGYCQPCEISFFLDFDDYSITFLDGKNCMYIKGCLGLSFPKGIKGTLLEYCPSIQKGYRGTVEVKDVEEWAGYINSTYKFGNELNVVDVANIVKYKEEYNLLFSGEKYLKSIFSTEKRCIEDAGKKFSKSNIGDQVDCFSSNDGKTYFYNGDKSKFADVHMEKGEELVTGKYYTYKDNMGCVAIHNSKLFFCNIVPVENINGKVPLYGLKLASSYDTSKTSYSSFIICVTENIVVLQNTLSELNGKRYGVKNYFADMTKNSKYYRYAGLIGIKDCRFSTLFKFDNAIYGFIRYNGTIKLLASRAKSAEEKKSIVQGIKKIISVPSFRELCIKRVYLYNVYSAESKISANLGLNKRFLKNYADFDELIKDSKSDSNVVLSVSCINKSTNKIESNLVLVGGQIIEIDGEKIKC